MNPRDLHACRCCGQIQHLVAPLPHQPHAAAVAGRSTARSASRAPFQFACVRCGTIFRKPIAARSAEAAAIALAAIIIYPLAISLPIMQIEQFGHRTETSIIGGIASMFAAGNWIVGLIVLLCSVLFPIGKLAAIMMLSWSGVAGFAGAVGINMTHHHKAATYRLVEWTGRWGMMDVLLVAILVAALKLGDVMQVTPGPAAVAFAACVILSMFASARFDPHSLWEKA